MSTSRQLTPAHRTASYSQLSSNLPHQHPHFKSLLCPSRKQLHPSRRCSLSLTRYPRCQTRLSQRTRGENGTVECSSSGRLKRNSTNFLLKDRCAEPPISASDRKLLPSALARPSRPWITSRALTAAMATASPTEATRLECLRKSLAGAAATARVKAALSTWLRWRLAFSAPTESLAAASR